MQLSFAVSEEEIVPLALGPLTGGGVAARTYFNNFESGGGSGINVSAPAGTGGTGGGFGPPV